MIRYIFIRTFILGLTAYECVIMPGNHMLEVSDYKNTVN